MKKLLSLLLVVSLVCSTGICIASEGATEEVEIIECPYPYPLPLPVHSITITEGWNLIAMPVLPLKPYTVRQFISAVESPFEIMPCGDIDTELLPKEEFAENAEVEKDVDVVIYPEPILLKKPWKVSVVAVYKNGRFERYPKEGVTYNMVPGEAYFVHAVYQGVRPLYPFVYPDDGTNIYWRPRKSVFIRGRSIDTPVTLNLNRGWSGASIMPTGSFEKILPIKRITSLNQLSDELVAQHIKATRIAFWSADRQEWEQYNLPMRRPPIFYELGELDSQDVVTEQIDEIVVFDRILRGDEGFFLLCEENGLFIPEKLDVYPPLPPYPPKPPLGEIIYHDEASAKE